MALRSLAPAQPRHRRRAPVFCCSAQLARVAVLGAGPGGLALALALRQLPAPPHVTVFDAESEATLRAARGAALNINGGASVLHDLGLGREVAAIANPLRRLVARTVGGWELMDVNIEAAIKSAGPAAAAGLFREGACTAVTVLRADLQRLLLDAALAAGAELRCEERVSGVEAAGPGAVTLATTAGPLPEQYDLVVGADGLRSAARRLLSGPDSAPQYSDIRIAFGVTDRADAAAEALRPAPMEAHQWFAPGAYALAYSAGQGFGAAGAHGAHCLALCWRAEGAVGENAGWVASAEARAAAVGRLSALAFPEEVAALARSATRFFELGVHHHDPLPAGGWVGGPGGLVVLLGDSAHAMPPFLGQGANQAIQDAAALATRLGGLGSTYATLPEALRAYEDARRGPTAALQLASRGVGLLETAPPPFSSLRDVALRFAGLTGAAGLVFASGATPRL